MAKTANDLLLEWNGLGNAGCWNWFTVYNWASLTRFSYAEHCAGIVLTITIESAY